MDVTTFDRLVAALNSGNIVTTLQNYRGAIADDSVQ
jgi:hypothetical protein